MVLNMIHWINLHHNDFTPLSKTNTDIDLAWNNVYAIVRVHNNETLNYGAYSVDGGTQWTSFKSFPDGTTGGGTICVSNDGKTFIWSPENTTSSFYSINQGDSWIPVKGLTNNFKVISDRVNPFKFYSYDSVKGYIYGSTDQGLTFSLTYSTLPLAQPSAYRDTSLIAVPGYEGHLWVTTSKGLHRSVDSGHNFTQITNVQEGYLVAVGKSLNTTSYPAVFLHGKVNNTIGVFRSDDMAVNWVRIDDDQHTYGGLSLLVGDPRVYGRVYTAAARGNGRGIIYGELSTN